MRPSFGQFTENTHGRRGPKPHPFGLRLAPLLQGSRRRRLGNITRRAVRGAAASHSACANGKFRNLAVSDQPAQLSWLCWSAIADRRLEQAPATTGPSCLRHKWWGVNKIVLHVAFCTNTGIPAFGGGSHLVLRLGPRNGQLRPLGQGFLATCVAFDSTCFFLLFCASVGGSCGVQTHALCGVALVFRKGMPLGGAVGATQRGFVGNGFACGLSLRTASFAARHGISASCS